MAPETTSDETASDELATEVATVRGVSDRVARRVAAAFPSRAELGRATEEELSTVKGVGPALAARLRDAFASPAGEAASTGGPTPTRTERVREDVREAAARLREAAAGGPRRESGAEAPEDHQADVRRAAGDVAAAAAEAADTLEQVAGDALRNLRTAADASREAVTAAADTVVDRWPEVRSTVGDALHESRVLGRALVSGAGAALQRRLRGRPGNGGAGERTGRRSGGA